MGIALSHRSAAPKLYIAGWMVFALLLGATLISLGAIVVRPDPASTTLIPDGCNCTVKIDTQEPDTIVTVSRDGLAAIFNTDSMRDGSFELFSARDEGSTVQGAWLVGNKLRIKMSKKIGPNNGADMVIVDLDNLTARVPS